MWAGLSRRKRRLVVTFIAAALFLVGALAVLARRGAAPAYRPGEPIEGLTAGLTRELPADHPPVTFTDATAAAGITFRHFDGRRSSQLPEDMGSGAAWGDYDNDGWPDLFVVNMAGPLTMSAEEAARSPARAHLYRNRGNGTFAEVAEQAGVAFRGWGMAAAWGDYDNDGWLDLLVTAYGRNALYRNKGDGTFTDVTGKAGLERPAAFWSGATWCDYDRDGLLDLYITGYVKYRSDIVSATPLQYDVEAPASLNPSSFEPEGNLLYHNQGDGTFGELALQAGVANATGRGLAAACTDLDGDGWPDLYVANDVSDNAFFLNRGGGAFEDLSYAARVADYRSAMGLATGDWDNDGDTDLFITHWIAQENGLFVNHTGSGPGGRRLLQFKDEADRWGLGQVSLDDIGWGTFFFDYDNDGRLDLFVVNGSTFQQREAPHLLVPMADRLFWNAGPERGFYDVSASAGPYFQEAHVGRGAAFADHDNDGDLDVFIVNHGGAARLLRNDGPAAGHWVKLRLEGTDSNRSAIGAKVRLVTSGGAQVREVGAQPSYLSGNDLVVYFGLGSSARVDSAEVEWSSGLRQRWESVPVDRFLHLTEGNDAWRELPGPPAVRDGVQAGVRPDAGSAGQAGRAGAARDPAAIRGFWEAFRGATAHRAAGRLPEAAEAYERALRLNPGHEDALYYLGNTRFALGAFAAAERAWTALAQINPRSARAHAQLGTLYACFEDNPAFDLARAEREFGRVLAINPEQVGPRLHLAAVDLARGDRASAAEHLEAVLGSDPDNRLARQLEGFLRWTEGPDRAESAEAVALFAAAAERQAAAPPPGSTGEGDTKTGTSAPTTRRAPCRTIDAWSEAASAAARHATAGGPAELRRAAERHYRALETSLARARR